MTPHLRQRMLDRLKGRLAAHTLLSEKRADRLAYDLGELIEQCVDFPQLADKLLDQLAADQLDTRTVLQTRDEIEGAVEHFRYHLKFVNSAMTVVWKRLMEIDPQIARMYEGR